jgi:Integrase core domain
LPIRDGVRLASTANCSKLGIDVGQTTVAKYMAKKRGLPSQGWKTFLVNHAAGIASMDLFVVPTISFRLLYGFPILLHARRELLWLGVTAHPTAEWIAQQFTEAFAWRNARDTWSVIWTAIRRPVHSARAGDGHSGSANLAKFAMQNGYAERLIRSIRRDCLDHVVVFGEPHLRNPLRSYQRYYNEGRTHLSLRMRRCP